MISGRVMMPQWDAPLPRNGSGSVVGDGRGRRQ